MRYRPPLKSPIQIKHKPLAVSPIVPKEATGTEVILSMYEIPKMVEEMRVLIEELKTKTGESLTQAQQAFDDKLAHFEHFYSQVKVMQKGAPGVAGPKPVAGVDYQVPENGKDANHEQVVSDVLKKVKVPTVDAVAVAKQAAKLVPVPETPQVDHGELAKAMVKHILENKLLKTDHIDGLMGELTSYRTQLAGKHYGKDTDVRGGGDTVAAGSGVTITNANGVKTISATGSSGITILAATETPNSNITIFTFAGATAQPSYLVVDNVWQRATSAAGTVNWTWNAGAKQATLAVPAIDEIYAVV